MCWTGRRRRIRQIPGSDRSYSGSSAGRLGSILDAFRFRFLRQAGCIGLVQSRFNLFFRLIDQFPPAVDEIISALPYGSQEHCRENDNYRRDSAGLRLGWDTSCHGCQTA